MGGSKHVTSQKYDGVIVQSSLKGIPIAKGWGTSKLGCNLIDYLDFTSKKVSTSGKGGGAQPNYDYYATLVLAITLGPIAGIRTIYKDSSYFIANGGGSKQVNGTTVTYSAQTPVQAAGLSQLFLGSIWQSPWTYLTTAHPGDALGYSGIAYAAAENYNLNSTATTPNFNFEVQFNVRGTVNGATVDDANPADILNDLLPDVPRWPGAGVIASLTFYQTYCYAQGLLLSPVANQGRQASDLITEIMTCSNSDCFVSEGLFQVVPMGDTPMGENNVSFTPNLTPIYSLTWDDILPNSQGEDPIQWDIKPTDQCHNYLTVGFLDRSQQYAGDSVPAVDQAAYNAFGKNQADAVTYESICELSVATTVAQLLVQRAANVRRTATFYVPEFFGLLDPMDLVEIPAPSGTAMLVRINSTAEQEDGSIELTVEEMLVGAGHAPLYTRQDGLGIPANFAIDPGDSVAPAIINPPVSLTNGANEVWLATAGGPEWGGANVWVSTDGSDFYLQGVVTQPGRFGATTTDFPASGGDPDQTDTLGVNLSASGGVLTTATQQNADDQTTLCAVGSEIIAYSAATLTGANTYDLGTYIRRGLEGTAIVDQPSGSLFMRLDESVCVIPYNSGQVGKTFYVKLQSFNLTGGGAQELELCETYDFIAEPNGQQVIDVTQVNGLGQLATLNAVDAIHLAATTGGNACLDTLFNFPNLYWNDGTNSTGVAYTQSIVSLGGRTALQRSFGSQHPASGKTFDIGQGPGSGISLTNMALPCQAGEYVEASAYIAASAVASAQCVIFLYDVNGVALGGINAGAAATTNLLGSGNTGLNSYVRVGGVAQIPPDGTYSAGTGKVAFATVRVAAITNGDTSNGCYLSVLAPVLRVATAGQVGLTPYTVGIESQLGADITANGTSKFVAGQGTGATTNVGALATLNAVTYGQSSAVGFGSLAGLGAVNFGSANLLETAGGAQATLANFKTSQGTAAYFNGQGGLATLSSVGYGSSYLTGFGALAPLGAINFGSANLLESSGGAQATLANFKTSQGTSAYLSGQSYFATGTGYGGLTGVPGALGIQGDGRLYAGNISYSSGGPTALSLQPRQAGADPTGSNTSAYVANQGTGATASSLFGLSAIDQQRLVSPGAPNIVQDPTGAYGGKGWTFTGTAGVSIENGYDWTTAFYVGTSSSGCLSPANNFGNSFPYTLQAELTQNSLAGGSVDMAVDVAFYTDAAGTVACTNSSGSPIYSTRLQIGWNGSAFVVQSGNIVPGYSGWTALYLTGTAPSNAVSARVRIYTENCTGGAGLVRHVQLRANANGPFPWADNNSPFARAGGVSGAGVDTFMDSNAVIKSGLGIPLGVTASYGVTFSPPAPMSSSSSSSLQIAATTINMPGATISTPSASFSGLTAGGVYLGSWDRINNVQGINMGDDPTFLNGYNQFVVYGSQQVQNSSGGYTAPVYTGGGGKNSCPDPEMPFLLANAERTGPGETIRCGDVCPGMFAWTADEHDFRWAAYEVTAVEHVQADERWAMHRDGMDDWIGSAEHPWLVELEGWVALAALTPGDQLLGCDEPVAGVSKVATGPVVRISTAAGTYVSTAVCHNKTVTAQQ